MPQLQVLIDMPSVLVSVSALFMAAVIAFGVNRGLMLALARDAVLPMGSLGLLIGSVKMLHALDDPAVVRPALGVGFLTVLYSLILYTFLIGIDPNARRTAPVLKGMHLVRMVLGHFLLAAVLYAAMAYKSPMLIFVDPTSIVLVVLGVGVPAGIGAMQPEAHRLRTILDRVLNACLCTTGIGMLIGGIGMAQSFGDPAAIGPFMAVGLLTPLYSGVIFLFCGLLRHCLLDDDDLPSIQSKTLLFVGMTGAYVVFSFGEILMLMME